MATNFEIFAAVDAYLRVGQVPSGSLSHAAPDGPPIRVATDGSTLSHAAPRGPTGWAYYVDDQLWRADTLERATSQCGELTAALQAITDAPSTRDLIVVTDSTYVASLIDTAGLTSEGDARVFRMTVRSDWLSVARLVVTFIGQREGSVTAERVPAHRGPATAPENQMADHLARRARWHVMARQGFPVSRTQRLVEAITAERMLAHDQVNVTPPAELRPGLACAGPSAA